MKRFLRGDTIIEVTLALAVFSGVIIMALALMNRGVSTAQYTLEMTLAREAMNTQAESLRYIHSLALADDSDAGPWQQVIGRQVDRPSPLAGLEGCSPPEGRAFVLNPRNPEGGIITLNPAGNTRLGQAEIYPRILFSEDTNAIDDLDGSRSPVLVEGLWIEAVRTSDGRAYDFHIRACWNAPGRTGPATATRATLGTIVRLYNPEHALGSGSN